MVCNEQASGFVKPDDILKTGQFTDYIAAAKRKIDQQMEVYGIQQMFDTVTCQRNITIPFLRITDELIRNTKEPELKEYIQERYRKPWLKRMSELPFD
jgi:hypothetical protein